MSDIIYELKDLHVSFPDMSRKPLLGAAPRIDVLKGLSFDIPKGEVLGIVGGSGSGKSTLGRALIRLIEPDSGAIRFEGTDITHLHEDSLRPLRRGAEVDWPDRALVIQSHRGDAPQRYHNALLRTQRWKLLCPSGFGGRNAQQPLELYDMLADPLEQRDRAGDFPEVVGDLQRAYNVWFDDVSSTRPDNYAPPRIHIGHPPVPRTLGESAIV